ncbi:hypothetical protein O181_039652 [Austropuccinia psidii MF-1]|uniref:Uncharacterized protein n=1 Tax=Austropuccinia psidii MF-1 TaxID=1389203 RepID=A0A9Q3DH83_9BASI|nr:hypothetical protein [Austropuccinia psidii MF-1]
MPSTRSGASYNPSRSSENSFRDDYGRSQSVTEGQAQRVPNPGISVEKRHELLPECEKMPGPSQNLQVTQWMAFMDGKEKHDSFNSRMEEKQPSTTQTNAKTSPNSQKQKFQHDKTATSSEQGKMQGTSHRAIQPGLQNSKYSTGFNGKYISDGQNHDGIT